jgi:hypothetical protein
VYRIHCKYCQQDQPIILTLSETNALLDLHKGEILLYYSANIVCTECNNDLGVYERWVNCTSLDFKFFCESQTKLFSIGTAADQRWAFDFDVKSEQGLINLSWKGQILSQYEVNGTSLIYPGELEQYLL